MPHSGVVVWWSALLLGMGAVAVRSDSGACVRGCGGSVWFVGGAPGGFVCCAAGSSRRCATAPLSARPRRVVLCRTAQSVAAPLSALVRHLGRRGSWFSRRVGGLSGAGSALVVQVRARAGACSAVGGGVALAWGAVRLLAGLPWSLSHSWARSQLLRLWWPRESDRGLVGGGGVAAVLGRPAQLVARGLNSVGEGVPPAPVGEARRDAPRAGSSGNGANRPGLSSQVATVWG